MKIDGVEVHESVWAGLETVCDMWRRGKFFTYPGFCIACGTTLFYYLVPANTYMMSVGAFEDQSPFRLVREIFIDCDADTVLLKVHQVGGAACHEGYKSCFYRKLAGGELSVIAERVVDPHALYGKK